MNTINRLQFRHHEEVFDTREDAIEYIYDKIKEEGKGLAKDQNSTYSFSLFAEPTILRYKNDDDETDVDFKKGPHIMLVIGSETNDSTYHNRNKFCIIDIDKTEDEIKNLEEELAKAIRSLTLAVLDTNTIDLHVEKTDEGTFLSGDVKTAGTHIFEGVVKENNLMTVQFDDEAGPEGLFIYVDLTYDEPSETFTFIVSQADGTLKRQSIKLPNNYIVSGEYRKEDESLHLHMKDGEEIIIDCEELIDEWSVEGEASNTPIVLTREEVDYSDETSEHHHVEPWQDVLRADVRIADDRPANILNKTTDGRCLYVDGVASNIVYYWNGDRSNVKEQLDKLNNIKISQDNDNIIWEKADGYFASTTLDYISSENKLILTTSSVNGTPIKHEVQLNTVEVIESITYDPVNEALVIKYKNDKGETKTVVVPISGMIDEWEVINDAHSVKLVKQRNVSGKDILTADVNISTADNNILEERGEGNIQALFVRGTADNIKYGSGTVESTLDGLIAEDEAINAKLQNEIDRSVAEDKKFDTTIGSGFSIDAHETVTYKFEQLSEKVDSESNKLQNEIDRSTGKDEEHDNRLNEQQSEIEAISADSSNSLKDIINNDRSINIDKTNPVKPVIKVNLSNKSGNTINLVTQDGSYGLYSTVDISYDSATNELTLTKSTSAEGETIGTTVKLNNGISVIERIEYDAATEEIVIYYRTTSSEEESIRIPVSHIINEWTTGETNTVLLNKERVTSGGSDILTANVKVCHDEHHQDNAIEVHQNGLYVHSYSGEVADLSSRINTVSGDVISEIARAEAAEQALDTKISQEISDRIAGINEEEIRALSAETALGTKIDNETTRAINAESELSTNLTSKIDTTAASISGYVVTQIEGEKSRAIIAEQTIDGKLIQEIANRLNAESGLSRDISDEVARAERTEGELRNAISAQTLNFKDTTSIDFERVGTDVTAIVKVATDSANIITNNGVGLYSTVDFEYNDATNTLTLKRNNLPDKEIQLNAGSIVDSIVYDSVHKNIIITYKTAAGDTRTVTIPAEELVNEWTVDNDGTPIKLTKTLDPSGVTDVLRADVKIASAHTDNLLMVDGDALYVPGDIIASAATIAECVSGKTDSIYKTLFGDAAPGGCGEGIEYKPDVHNCIISAATSFQDADQLMAYQLCEILEMWVSGMTCTSISNWVDDGANKKMLVDVRASAGNRELMDEDDLYITDLTGKTIEPGVTEFTDTNALRIVCLENGGSVIPDVKTIQNGIYLSNVWDCGKYYDSTNATDMEGHNAVQADGYNADYWTDNDASASGYNYNNNVRR